MVGIETVGRVLTFILVPLLTCIGVLVILEFIRWTGLFTTDKTIEYVSGSPVPEWKSKRHFQAAAVVFMIMFLTIYGFLLIIADVLISAG